MEERHRVPTPDSLAVMELPATLQNAQIVQGGVVLLQLQVAMPPEMIEGMTVGRMTLMQGRSEAFQPLVEAIADAPILRLVMHRASLAEKAKAALIPTIKLRGEEIPFKLDAVEDVLIAQDSVE
jgi:hypothetical protein